jgi:hypothetical protein
VSAKSGCGSHRNIPKEEMVLVAEAIEFLQEVSKKDL